MRADTLAGVARRIYVQEASGGVGHAAVRRIARDRSLCRRAGSATTRSALRAAALRQLFDPGRHVVRLSLRRGGRTLTDVGGRFVARRRRLRLHGAVLEASMQDVIGYVKLVHRLVGVSGRGARRPRARRGLAGRRHGMALPASGTATVAGHRDVVRAFHERGYDGEPLTVWILSA